MISCSYSTYTTYSFTFQYPRVEIWKTAVRIKAQGYQTGPMMSYNCKHQLIPNFAIYILPILHPSLTPLNPVVQEQLCKMGKAAVGRHSYVTVITRTSIGPDYPTTIFPAIRTMRRGFEMINTDWGWQRTHRWERNLDIETTNRVTPTKNLNFTVLWYLSCAIGISISTPMCKISLTKICPFFTHGVHCDSF